MDQRAAETPAARSRRAWSLAVGVVVLLALALRLWGIDWGAPYIYHADEHYVLHRALDMVRERDLNPHWFQYPTLLIYVQSLLILVVQPFAYAPLTSNPAINGIGPWDALPEQWPFVLAGRLVVALSGAASVLLLGASGRRWHSAAAGLVAALGLALLPLHVDNSHYLTTDIPAVALVIATLWASLRAQPEARWAWLTPGLLAGLAAGTKYTTGFVIIAPIVMALDRRQPLSTLQRLTYVGIGALIAFLLACPYALLDMTNFLRGLDEQHRNYLASSTPDRAWYWYLEYLWRGELQPGAAAAALIGVGFTLRRRRRVDFAVLLPPLFYYAVVGPFPSRPERNVLPLLPFLCLLIGVGVVEVGKRILAGRLPALAITALALLVMVNPAREAVRLNRERARPDTRSIAGQWIEAHVPPNTCIAREEYTPQLSTTHYRVLYSFSLAYRPYSWYLGQQCRYIVASSHIYGRVYNPPYIGGSTAAEFYRVLFTLPRLAEFAPGPDDTGPTIRIFQLPLGE